MTDSLDSSVKLELLQLTEAQESALLEALDRPHWIADADHRVLGALRRRGLINDADRALTTLGRYQVRWYVEDAAAAWNVQPDSFGHYVTRGRAPSPDGFEDTGGTIARAFWRPATVLDYDRGPGRGNFERTDLDMQTIVREFRAGVSIRNIAKKHGVSATTVTNRLEELGEKPTTSASRTAYRRDQRATISADGAG